MTTEILYPHKNISVKFHNDYAKQHYPKRISDFKTDPLNHGDIIFIGNSITEEGGDWSKKLNIEHIRNRGISGDNTDGVLARLNEIIYYKPKMVFLLIGTNDVDNLVYLKQVTSAEYIVNNILKITSEIHKGSQSTKIYVQTILPSLDEALNIEIEKINTILKTNTTDYSFEIVNLHDAFTDDTNSPKTELYRDRLHLNKKGYKVWTEVLKPYF